MDNKKVMAVVLARMGSERFPGKNLAECLNGRSCLELLIERVLRSKMIDKVIIATTEEKQDDIIAEMFREGWTYDIDVFRGSTNDVIGRVGGAADHFKATHIVDITADCPFVDPVHIDYLVAMLLAKDKDYVSNVMKRTWPDGFDIQVYTKKALDLILENTESAIRKNAGWNFVEYKEFFKVDNWEAPWAMRYPDWGLTFDTSEDYKLIKEIYSCFGHNNFSAEELVKFLLLNPELLEINKSVKRKNPEEG